MKLQRGVMVTESERGRDCAAGNRNLGGRRSNTSVVDGDLGRDLTASRGSVFQSLAVEIITKPNS